MATTEQNMAKLDSVIDGHIAAAEQAAPIPPTPPIEAPKKEIPRDESGKFAPKESTEPPPAPAPAPKPATGDEDDDPAFDLEEPIESASEKLARLRKSYT